jgi:hypothetical protein
MRDGGGLNSEVIITMGSLVVGASRHVASVQHDDLRQHLNYSEKYCCKSTKTVYDTDKPNKA